MPVMAHQPDVQRWRVSLRRRSQTHKLDSAPALTTPRIRSSIPDGRADRVFIALLTPALDVGHALRVGDDTTKMLVFLAVWNTASESSSAPDCASRPGPRPELWRADHGGRAIENPAAGPERGQRERNSWATIPRRFILTCRVV